MIEFKCQHCGKGLHLNDSYAGRDGWCRVCKRMVIVPGSGPVIRVEDLPPEEGYERLQRLLQYAATKADKYKVFLTREAKEKEHAAQVEESLRQTQAALVERESALERLREDYVSLASTLRQKEERLEALASASEKLGSVAPALELELGTLRAELALERESRQALETALSERDGAIGALEDEVATLRKAVLAHVKVEELAAADRVSLRAFEGAVATLKSQLAQAEGERDRLAELLEEGAPGENEGTLLLLQKDREISALTANVAELKTQQEDSNRATRDKIAALESQVLLFNDMKERMGALQARIKELEQERLDQSLSLDGAHQSEHLLQKKLAALEISLQEALAAQSERAIQSDQYQRELAVRDEQVRKLTKELQSLTEAQGSASLEAEKSARAARAAESRAEHFATEIESLQDIQNRLQAENDQSRRAHVELEARVVSLSASLDAARADVAEKSSHKPAMAALQAELSEVRLALQRAEEDGAAEKASLAHTVAELQAEVMNLSEALERESASEALRAALETAERRVAMLESQLEERAELDSLHQVEEEHLARDLSESRARIATLEAELAAGARDGDSGAGEDDDEEDVGFILLSPEQDGRAAVGAAPAVVATEGIDEQRRQLEKKQMMDALSDFLNK